MIDDVVDTYRIEIHAYCLMRNHYHLLVNTSRGNLGQAMRHLNSIYTQRFNRKIRRDGPLFRGRYKAILVDADSYLSQVNRYIHLNPVESGAVRDPAEHRWSSYRAYVGLEEPPRWLNLDATLELFGQGRRVRGVYRAFVLDGVDEETKRFYGNRKHGPLLGDQTFRQRMTREAKRSLEDREISERKYLRKQIPVDKIVRCVAKGFKVDQEDLLRDGRGRRGNSLPRMVGMVLSRRPGGHSLRMIGERFGLDSYTAVSAAKRRLEEKIARDQALAGKIELIRSELFGN